MKNKKINTYYLNYIKKINKTFADINFEKVIKLEKLIKKSKKK